MSLAKAADLRRFLRQHAESSGIDAETLARLPLKDRGRGADMHRVWCVQPYLGMPVLVIIISEEYVAESTGVLERPELPGEKPGST